MSKDVINDRYARLYEIPYQLARLGHDVLIFSIGYQGQLDGRWEHEASPGRLRIESLGVRKPWVLDLASYPAKVLATLRSFRPDIVLGASDIPNVALAAWLARKLRTPYAVDLYDNFESFGQARLPGMKTMLRLAARHANVVTTTSEPLAQLVREKYQARGAVISMPSTVNKDTFRPRDKMECRQALGLPTKSILVGTAGGLHRTKGIGDLFAAWDILSADTRIHLVLAGPLDGSIEVPVGDRVHYLGQLPHDRIAMLFSALDVATICILDTPFGRYCFPQKAYEIMATGTPVVASAVGAIKGVLAAHGNLLYPPGDPGTLAARVHAQLLNPEVPIVDIQDWAGLIARMEMDLVEAVEKSKGEASA